MSTEIKQLDTLINEFLENGKKYVSYDCKKLLASGENYGSTMLLVLVKLLNERGEEEILQCVGKTGPPSDFLWEFFNVKATFKKEIAVYSIIVPELNQYGRENGLNSLTAFAKCIGARISLNPQALEVDENALLLLENLKVQGYDVTDRCIGFDETVSKMLLTDLAVIHAVTIGYKLAKPEEFNTKIFPHLRRCYTFDPPDELIGDIVKSIQDAAAKNPECVPYLSKIDKSFRDIKYYLDNPPKGKEIFATMTHNDFWVNNIMVKYENGKPTNTKMLDFQIMEYSSLAHDVIFFLYSSVELSVLENKCDELIKYYYEQFIHTLSKLKCDTNEYSYASLMEEFALIAGQAQFSHTMYMLRAILTLKGEAKELSEFNYSGFVVVDSTMHQNYYKRLQFFLLDFVKRGWI